MEQRTPPSRSDEAKAMDFLHGQLVSGSKIRVLTVVVTFSRFSPAVEPRSATVARISSRCRSASVVSMSSRKPLASTKGTEFGSRDDTVIPDELNPVAGSQRFPTKCNHHGIPERRCVLSVRCFKPAKNNTL